MLDKFLWPSFPSFVATVQHVSEILHNGKFDPWLFLVMLILCKSISYASDIVYRATIRLTHP